MTDRYLSETIIKILEPEHSSDEGSITFLNGPWGVGKTHFWKSSIQKSLTKRKCLYVSLFGVKDVSDIKEKILATILAGEQDKSKTAWLRKKVSQFNVPQNLTSLLEKWAGLSIKFDILEMDWVKYTVCFDDLERLSSSASMEEVLGFMNYLSEHKGYRCLVILNEDEMQPDLKKEFLRLREKLSLRSFQIPFNLDDRLDNFVENRSSFFSISISPSEKEILRRNLKKVQADNLRTVRFVVDNFLQLRSSLKRDLPEPDIKFLISMVHHEAKGHKESWDFYNFNATDISYREYSRTRENPAPPPEPQTIFYDKYYGGNENYTARKCIYDLVHFGYCDTQSAKNELFPDAAKLSPSEFLAQQIKNTHFFFSNDNELREIIEKVEVFFKSSEELSFDSLYMFIKGYSSAFRLLELEDPTTLPEGFLNAAKKAVHGVKNPLSYSSGLNLSNKNFLQIFIEAFENICREEDVRQKTNTLDKAIDLGQTNELVSYDYESSEILERIFSSGQFDKIWHAQNLDSDERYRLLEGIIKAMSMNSHREMIKAELDKVSNFLKDTYNASTEKMIRLRTYRLLQATGRTPEVQAPLSLSR